jgi:hypothetical protein
MPRKKKNENIQTKPIKKTKTIMEPETKYFVDGHGDVREYYEPVVEYVINWEKIAADVKAAAEMIKHYEKDDGPLTKSQLKQIKLSAPKFTKKKTT